MTTQPLQLGSHLLIALEGESFTDPSAGTVGRESTPGAADSVWRNLGIVSEGELELAMEEREVWGPSPGRFRLHDVIENKGDLKFNATLEEVSDVITALAFGSGVVNSGQFNPLERGIALKAWTKVQIYNQFDNSYVTADLYSRLKLSSALNVNGLEVRPQVEARVLYSTLNNANLAA